MRGDQISYGVVSTHSRPKAAGLYHVANLIFLNGFNTQPPEGGWRLHATGDSDLYRFNTQPPEGGWGR